LLEVDPQGISIDRWHFAAQSDRSDNVLNGSVIEGLRAANAIARRGYNCRC
jgi:hypothetical protein